MSVGASMIRVDVDAIFGPLVRYLKDALAVWQPTGSTGPQIVYRLRTNHLESPKMTVQVMELPRNAAANNALNYQGVSPESDPRSTSQPSFNSTSSSQADEDHSFGVKASKAISDGIPEAIFRQVSPSSQKGAPSQPKQHMVWSESAKAYVKADVSPSPNPTSSPRFFSSDSQIEGEALSVPMKVNNRLTAQRSGSGNYDFKGVASSSTYIPRPRSRENRFRRRASYQGGGESTHRHEGEIVETHLRQEQEGFRDEDDDEDSSTDEESGGVGL
ncbi:MAG: hypothetical protein Q9218_002525 [Villophora microphyllina]